MVSGVKLSVAFLLLAVPFGWGFDFRPVEVKGHGEGGHYEYLQFSNRGRPVTYSPPRHWGCQGRGDVLHLTPPGPVEAEIEIRALPVGNGISASAENLKAFEQLALDSLPKGASKIEKISVTLNPIEIDGKKSVEITHSYVFYGQPLTVSRLYVPLTSNPNLLRFTIVANAGDFAGLRQSLYTSLHTLAGL